MRAPAETLGFAHHFVPATGSSRETLLLLHGTGGNEDDLIPVGRLLAPKAALLSPRGKVLERGMPRFFRRLAEGVFDIPDLLARTDELAEFARAAPAHYGVDSAAMTVVGFSNGANIAASLLLLHPGLVSRAVLFRAMVPFEPEAPPALRGTRVFMGSGRHDPIITASNSERLAALLREAEADVTLAWQPTGHNLTPEDVEEARRWLTAPTAGG